AEDAGQTGLPAHGGLVADVVQQLPVKARAGYELRARLHYAVGSGAFFLRSLAREAAAELQQGDELLRGKAADAAARVRIALQVRHAELPEERSGRDLRPEQRAALGQALGQLPQGGKIQRAALQLRRGHAAAQAEALRHLIERAVPAQGVE